MVASVSMYDVAVIASDGANNIESTPPFPVPVESDNPPCMTASELPAGSYVLDRSQTTRFEITGVADDRDPYGSALLTYSWSLWREADPTWRTVPMHPQSDYELDGSTFGVGEKVRLRAQAVDRTGLRATGCPIDQPMCAVASCTPGPDNSCQAWITWDLEMR
jgi:hypothetical protein